jgi:hypothetical protein
MAGSPCPWTYDRIAHLPHPLTLRKSSETSILHNVGRFEEMEKAEYSDLRVHTSV